MEACLSIKFAYLDWLACIKCLLGGHGKARRTVNRLCVFFPDNTTSFRDLLRCVPFSLLSNSGESLQKKVDYKTNCFWLTPHVRSMH